MSLAAFPTPSFAFSSPLASHGVKNRRNHSGSDWESSAVRCITVSHQTCSAFTRTHTHTHTNEQMHVNRFDFKYQTQYMSLGLS